MGMNTSPSFQTITINRSRSAGRQRQIFGVPISIALLLLSIVTAGGLSAGAFMVLPWRGEVAKQPEKFPLVAPKGKKVPAIEEQPAVRNGSFALRFDGKDDYVEFPMIPLQATDPVTIEAWITPTGDYSDRPQTPWIDGHIYGWERFEDLCLAAYAEGLGASLNAAPLPEDKGVAAYPIRRDGLNVGKRQHLALTLEGTRATLFVDGQKVGTQLLPRGIGSRRTSPMMGAFIDGRGLLERAFDGLIDEVRLSRCVRYRSNFNPDDTFEIDAESVAVYHFDDQDAEVLKDSTSNRYHGTIKGATWEARRR
jgi:hypothetical protein